MGLTTLAGFRSQVNLATGNTGVSSDSVDDWINFAYQEVCSAVDFEELEEDFSISTVVGTSVYSGPINPLGIRLIRNITSNEQLTWVHKQEIWRLSSLTGIPKKWSRHKNDIIVHPTPSQVFNLSVVYKKTPEILSSPSDVTEIPSAWDPLVMMLAVHYALLTLNEEPRAITWFNRAVMYGQGRITEGNFKLSSPGLKLTEPDWTALERIPADMRGEI